MDLQHDIKKRYLLHSPLKALRPPIRVVVRQTFSVPSSRRGCNRCAPKSLWFFPRRDPCARDRRRWRLWPNCRSIPGRLLRQHFRTRLCRRKLLNQYFKKDNTTKTNLKLLIQRRIHFTWTSVCRSSWLRTGKRICWTHAQGLIRETVPARPRRPPSGTLSGHPMHDRQDLSDSVFLEE